MTSKELAQAFAQEEHEKRNFAEESNGSQGAALERVRGSKRFERAVAVTAALGTALVVYLGARKNTGGRHYPG